MSIFDGIGTWLFPTSEAAEPKTIFRWRQVVSLSILLLGGSLIVGDALAWGFVPVIYSGFGTVTQVQGLSDSLFEIRSSQVEREIIETRERQCSAQEEKNLEALQFATAKISASLDSYKKTTGRDFRVPECNELIVAKTTTH